ncbi:hypothetical protein ACLOJK_010553 [Asimina triloba]
MAFALIRAEQEQQLPACILEAGPSNPRRGRVTRKLGERFGGNDIATTPSTKVGFGQLRLHFRLGKQGNGRKILYKVARKELSTYHKPLPPERRSLGGLLPFPSTAPLGAAADVAFVRLIAAAGAQSELCWWEKQRVDRHLSDEQSEFDGSDLISSNLETEGNDYRHARLRSSDRSACGPRWDKDFSAQKGAVHATLAHEARQPTASTRNMQRSLFSLTIYQSGLACSDPSIQIFDEVINDSDLRKSTRRTMQNTDNHPRESVPVFSTNVSHLSLISTQGKERWRIAQDK